MSALRSLYRQWRQHWFALEAIPLYTILGFAGAGTAWYLTHLASRPEVLWARKANPTPWNSVKPDETTKLWHGERAFDKTWKREKL